MFTYLAHASPLHRLNPAAKLAGIAVVALAATVSFDPFVLIMLAAALWLTAWLLGRIPLKQMLRWSLPLLLLPLPVMLFNALYADLSRYAQPHILWHWGIWTLSVEGLWAGLGMGLRVMVFVASSLLFIATTDPTDFALSLVQNLKVPPRFGYGMLVSYRFLPLLRQEYETIRMAHRVRGVGERGGWRGWLVRFRRYAIPLLAAAVRKSERTALAMDARAFGALPRRTYYREMRVRRGDVVFVLALVAYVGLVFALAAHWGWVHLQWVPGG